MGIIRKFLGNTRDEKEHRRTRDEEQREHINDAIELHHEVQRNNYYRREVINANQERRRNGQPELPVPPFDGR